MSAELLGCWITLVIIHLEVNDLYLLDINLASVRLRSLLIGVQYAVFWDS